MSSLQRATAFVAVLATAVAILALMPAEPEVVPIQVASTVEAAARSGVAALLGPRAPRAVFPVRGPVDFGDWDARFGSARGEHQHEGQDVFAEPGTPVVAIRAGRVVERGDDGGRGNYVAFFSPAVDRTYVYLHMLRPAAVREGARVEAGERLGAVGCTGSCWGNHLHVEVRRGRGTTGRPLDPLPLLRRLARSPR
jgi:murein DD-endopeptidase MepM/ murein hydrolase activator NlpD